MRRLLERLLCWGFPKPAEYPDFYGIRLAEHLKALDQLDVPDAMPSIAMRAGIPWPRRER